jgi:gamma-glutamyltranspeptidase
MAWSDEPTYAQVQTVYRWIEWHMSTNEARNAVNWLKEHATRKEVSNEIKRLHDLYYGHKLDKESCTSSSVWEGYSQSSE